MIAASQVELQLDKDFEQLISDALTKQPQARRRLVDYIYEGLLAPYQIKVLLSRLQDTVAKNPNHDQAIFFQALWHYTEEGTDFTHVIEQCNKAISAGNVDAINLRGMMHENGEGCPKNKDLACALYEQGIALNNPHCMYNRARIYCEQAAALLGEMEEQGYSQYQLACQYRQLGIELYERAASLGNPHAMYACGEIFSSEEESYPINEDLAVQYFSKALKAGYQKALAGLIAMACHRIFPAQYCVFKAYFLGDGVEKNVDFAVQYYVKTQNAYLMLNALCDEILAEINATGQLKATKDFYLLIQTNSFFHEHSNFAKLWLIKAKILLAEKQDNEALSIFKTLLTKGETMSASDLFQFASVQLSLASTITDQEQGNFFKDQACDMLYAAHIQGDNKAYSLLLVILREREDRLSNSAVPPHLHFDQLSPLQEKQLISNFLVLREYQGRAEIISQKKLLREQQLQSLQLLLGLNLQQKSVLKKIIAVMLIEPGLDLQALINRPDVLELLDDSLKAMLNAILDKESPHGINLVNSHGFFAVTALERPQTSKVELSNK